MLELPHYHWSFKIKSCVTTVRLDMVTPCFQLQTERLALKCFWNNLLQSTQTTILSQWGCIRLGGLYQSQHLQQDNTDGYAATNTFTKSPRTKKQDSSVDNSLLTFVKTLTKQTDIVPRDSGLKKDSILDLQDKLICSCTNCTDKLHWLYMDGHSEKCCTPT